MNKNEISKSQLIFDINELKQKISHKLYLSALDKEGIGNGEISIYKDIELSSLDTELLLSLRATLASYNYNSLLENQKTVEEVLNGGSIRFYPRINIYWNSLKEFRLNYWNKLTDAHKQVISLRTEKKLIEHVLTNNDNISYYYYTLELN